MIQGNVQIAQCIRFWEIDTDWYSSDITVTIEDFALSMAKVGPSIQRGYETIVEKKTWDDIGGLEEVKKVPTLSWNWYKIYYFGIY